MDNKQQDSKDFLLKRILSEDTILYVSIHTTLGTTLMNTDCLTFPLHNFIIFYVILLYYDLIF